MKKIKLLFSIVFFGLLANSCSTEDLDYSVPETKNSSQLSKIYTGFPETFESGSKTSYVAADITLPTGIWNLNDALIGTLSGDRKNGTKSIRIQNIGKVTMKFNSINGASSVSVLHAKYGTDASSSWELWYSTNSGSSWTKTGGTITTSSTTLQTATFPLMINGNVRFEIRKISGGTNRINIDDIIIDDNIVPIGGIFPETFESGSKTSYTPAVLTLSTGNWNFDNALIGISTSDVKNGTKSARITDIGRITMQFDVTTGASSVSVLHAKYGTDTSSSWELWYSTDSGISWTKTGGTITTSSTTLQTAIFPISVQGNIRFEVRKITGTGIRINIDDLSITAYSGTGGTGGSGAGGVDGDHIAMGNPSGATTNIANENNYLMEKAQFKLSYNRSKATPNWVSWHLDPTWIGTATRQDDFRADTTLPAGWYQVGSTSYSGSGFDRGHNCPSADRTSSVAANSETFLMTNMIPQAPVNNQQTWANLEAYGRTLVSQGYEVYIIMGCYGAGGTGSAGSATTINNGNITVPSNIWKVLVILPQGTYDVSRVTTGTRVIAVNTPNINTTGAWGTYRTSVDAIEAATGYDLLSNLSTSIQASIEANVDNGPTN
jgi:endonuclease G